jgi:hypothetical protein
MDANIIQRILVRCEFANLIIGTISHAVIAAIIKK